MVTKLQNFLFYFVGNRRIFSNRFIRSFEKGDSLAFWNDVTFVAPGFKWALSIIPLYGVLVGNPKVEHINIRTSASLSFTGIVWAYYSLLIQPQNMGSLALSMCNACMGLVNGFNVWRKYRYDQKLKVQ